MTPLEREIAVLDREKASLVANGFEVITHPTDLDLPEFLKGLHPDAVAHRGDEHLVIEVTSRSAPTQAKLRLLRDAINGNPGWHLRTVWMSGSSVPKSLETPKLEAVASALEDVNDLLDAGHLHGAFLMCWAALEGLGRFLIPDELQKPQTPGRVVEYLGSRGFVTRQEASNVRKLVKLRNSLVHGELQTLITEDDVVEIRDVLWSLYEIAKQGPETD